MTRSKTLVFNQDVDNKKKIEMLKQEIDVLTSIENFENGQKNEDTSVKKRKSYAKGREGLKEEEIKQQEKQPEQEQQLQEDDKQVQNKTYESGYLKYSHRNILAIIFATIVVMIIFYLINWSTLTNKFK